MKSSGGESVRKKEDFCAIKGLKFASEITSGDMQRRSRRAIMGGIYSGLKDWISDNSLGDKIPNHFGGERFGWGT